MVKIGKPEQMLADMEMNRVVDSKAIATKIYILALCGSKDEVSAEEIYGSLEVPRSELVDGLGIYSSRGDIQEVRDRLFEAGYIEKENKYDITDKGRKLLSYYSEMVLLEADLLLLDSKTGESIAEVLDNIQEYREDTAELNSNQKQALLEEVGDAQEELESIRWLEKLADTVQDLSPQERFDYLSNELEMGKLSLGLLQRHMDFIMALTDTSLEEQERQEILDELDTDRALDRFKDNRKISFEGTVEIENWEDSEVEMKFSISEDTAFPDGFEDIFDSFEVNLNEEDVAEAVASRLKDEIEDKMPESGHQDYDSN